jgi:hypothetical protein
LGCRFKSSYHSIGTTKLRFKKRAIRSHIKVNIQTAGSTWAVAECGEGGREWRKKWVSWTGSGTFGTLGASLSWRDERGYGCSEDTTKSEVVQKPGLPRYL